MLFLVVMDSLIQQLHQSGGGLSIHSLTISSTVHADDICSVSDSLEGLQKQLAIIDIFAGQFHQDKFRAGAILVTSQQHRRHRAGWLSIDSSTSCKMSRLLVALKIFSCYIH